MRGGFLLGLSIGLCLFACGGGSKDDFADDPEKAGEAGKGGSSGSGMGGSAGNATGGSAGNAMGGSANAGTGGGSVCVPGATQPCLGPGACMGAQSCVDSGDAWGTCDCGSDPAGGSGGTGGAGSGASGGDANQGGGGTGGTAGKGGTGGAAGKGGSGGSDSACDASCDAYCSQFYGACVGDDAPDDCVSSCHDELCTTSTTCHTEELAFHECIAGATPACVSNQSLPSGADCRAEGKALYDCVDLAWHCNEADGSCVCSRGTGTGSDTCEQSYDCCVADVAGITCGCGSSDFCALTEPAFTMVDHCPLD